MNTVEPIRDIGKIWDIADYLGEQNERNRIMFLFGIYVGLRISDILKLKVRDVRDKTHVMIREQKTGKEKAFPINQELKPILNRYMKDKADYDYLFPSRKEDGSKPITRQQAYNVLNDAAGKFGMERIGTHTLRKTFGYHFYQQTKDIATLKEIFNHSDVAITFRYIGINQDIKDQKMMKLSFKRQ